MSKELGYLTEQFLHYSIEEKTPVDVVLNRAVTRVQKGMLSYLGGDLFEARDSNDTIKFYPSEVERILLHSDCITIYVIFEEQKADENINN